MTYIVRICNILTGNLYQEIQYDNLDDLHDKLKLLIKQQDPNILMRLIINSEILNNFDIIDTFILSKIDNNNCILVIFRDIRTMYCLGNEHGKYILDFKNDKYSELLKIIIKFYTNDSYNIIINNSYKDLVLKAVIKDPNSLRFANTDLQNDKEVVLTCVKKCGCSIIFASILLRNDKEIVLEAVKEYGYALYNVNKNFRNNKEVVLEAVKKNGKSLKYASINLQDDKEIVLEAVKQNGKSLEYASITLQDNKEIVLEAVKQNRLALQYVSINLQNDEDIILQLN